MSSPRSASPMPEELEEKKESPYKIILEKLDVVPPNDEDKLQKFNLICEHLTRINSLFPNLSVYNLLAYMQAFCEMEEVDSSMFISKKNKRLNYFAAKF